MIQVFVKTLWGELLSIECHEYDSLEDIGRTLHCDHTEEFPRIPLITREKDGLLEDGEILCLVPYPEVEIEIHQLDNRVRRNLVSSNPPLVYPDYSFKVLYEAHIQTGHGVFYVPFLISFSEDNPIYHSFTLFTSPGQPSDLSNRTFQPSNRAAQDLLLKLAEHSPAIHINGELLPYHVNEYPTFEMGSHPWGRIDNLGGTIAKECMEGVTEHHDYVQSYLERAIQEKWEEIMEE